MTGHATSGNSRSLLMKNARVLDGLGAVKGAQCIHIEAGKIVEIGRDVSIKGLPVLDVAGATVLPGLIDAHVHLQSVPGAVFRKDSEEALRKYRYHQLRAYLACGVTSVLDNAISSLMLREFQDYLSAGGIGPHLYALAPAFYPPDGYLDHGMLTPYWGPQWRAAGSKEDILSLFDEYKGTNNIVGVKVLLETGFGKSRIWPLHSPEIRKIIMDEASERGLPLYIHAYKEKEQAIGLEMGVHTFVHSGFIFKQPKSDFLERMKEQGTYVATTLSCSFDQMLVNFELERLDDEYLRLTVPDELLQTARNLEAWDAYYDTFFKTSFPKWMPSVIRKAITRMLNIEKMIRSCLDNASRALVTMHESGIPVVVGTDASSWPVFLNFFHGTSTIREMELLVEAGMSPMDVIASATRIPAKMMGLEELIGTIEPGKRADLVVVRGDPLEDISALKSVAWTIKEGEAHPPEEWMSMDV
ncbi:MAG: amidohydrolase family protein [Pseudodesulfovibrio sp.]|uniref:amidohydrolase family protein n=1 Tax=Pseudodesulfovibrio sp. TaxID=2035812 RepID=UPI003D13BAD7